MFIEIFNDTQIKNQDQLQYFLNVDGCSLKIENQSPYALEVYYAQQLADRVNPYSYVILPNSDYELRINKQIKSDNEQPFNFVTVKTFKDEIKEETGAAQFSGTANVAGDMVVKGGQIDAYIQGDMRLEEGTTVNAVITEPIQVAGDLKLAEGTTVQAEIKGDLKLDPSTTVTANISNAEIKTELVNASVSTNPVVPFGKGYQDKWFLIGEKGYLPELITQIHENAGMYDTVVLSMSTIVYRERTAQILSGPMYDDILSNVGFLLSGMPNLLLSGNTTEYQEFLGEEGISIKEVLGTGDTTKQVRQVARSQFTIKANEPFLFNTLDLNLKFSTPTITKEDTDKVFCKLNAFVYNSKSFNVIKEGGNAKLSYLDMNGGINMHNKSISNIDGLYFNDPTDGGTEGLNFPRTAGGSDLLRVLNGQVLLNNAVAYEELTTVHAALNLNTLSKNGTYYSHSLTNAIGKPAEMLSGAGFVTHIERTDGYATQTIESATLEFQVFKRRKMAGVWGEWEQLKTFSNELTMQGGNFNVVPTASNTVTSQRITFDKPFKTVPFVTIEAKSAVPQLVTHSIGEVDRNGFTIFMTRTNTTGTNFNYIAIG